MSAEAIPAIDTKAEEARIFGQKGIVTIEETLSQPDLELLGIFPDVKLDSKLPQEYWTDDCPADGQKPLLGLCSIDGNPRVILAVKAGGYCYKREAKEIGPGIYVIGYGNGVDGDGNDLPSGDECEGYPLHEVNGGTPYPNYPDVTAQPTDVPPELKAKWQAQQATIIAPNTPLPPNEQDPIFTNIKLATGALNTFDNSLWEQGYRNKGLEDLVKLRQKVNESGKPVENAWEIELGNGGPEYSIEIYPNEESQNPDQWIIELDSGGLQMHVNFLGKQQTLFIDNINWQGRTLGLALRWNPEMQALLYEGSFFAESGASSLNEEPGLNSDYSALEIVSDNEDQAKSVPGAGGMCPSVAIPLTLPAAAIVYKGIKTIEKKRQKKAEKKRT